MADLSSPLPLLKLMVWFTHQHMSVVGAHERSWRTVRNMRIGWVAMRLLVRSRRLNVNVDVDEVVRA